MDDTTRERLLNQLRCYLLDVADHATEYGCIGTVLVNDIAGKAMAAIDEATAPQWTAVTLDTTPPDGTVVLGWWGYDYEVCATWRIRGTWYTQARGATTFPPSHYMPLPPAPLDA